MESFEVDLDLPFLTDTKGHMNGAKLNGTVGTPFRGVFIRAPVVEKVLPVVRGEQIDEAKRADSVIAPAKLPGDGAERMMGREVEVLGVLKGRKRAGGWSGEGLEKDEVGDIIAVRQGNVFGTSFHPELTRDPRIHEWWLQQVVELVKEQRDMAIGT